MAHIQDRWWNVEIRNNRKVRVKSPRYKKGKRWKAVYIDPQGRERSRSFEDGDKGLAEAFIHDNASNVHRGSYLDPERGKMEFGAYAADWAKGHRANPSTKEDIERKLRLHIVPFFGGMSLASIRPNHVRKWIAGMEGRLGASTQEVAFTYLREILNAAIDDERLPKDKNPCSARSVNPPKAVPGKVQPWPVAQVRAVRTGLSKRYQAMVDVGAGCGLRSGEIFGLSPSDRSEDGSLVHVQRQVKIVGNRLVFAPPKGGRDRFVPLPESVSKALMAHENAFAVVPVALPWESPNGKLVTVPLYFTTDRGGPIKRNDFMSHGWGWKKGLAAAGVEPGQRSGMHALRHYYASVLLDAGETVKAIAEYMGHKDPAFTLSTYTHLMPSSKDRTRDAIDAAWTS